LLRLFHSALSARSLAPYVLVSAEARGVFDGSQIDLLFSARVSSRAPPAFVL
jgi:hypothetical protein